MKQGRIRFDDSTRIAPNVDVLAVTEYRRYTDTTTAAAAGARAGPEGIASQGAGNIWRISLHAYGDIDDLHLDMTSDPPLSQEDIVLLLTIGMTGAEVAQGRPAARHERRPRGARNRERRGSRRQERDPPHRRLPLRERLLVEDGRTEPQVIVGKHLANAVRATVATSVGEDQELRATVESG